MIQYRTASILTIACISACHKSVHAGSVDLSSTEWQCLLPVVVKNIISHFIVPLKNRGCPFREHDKRNTIENFSPAYHQRLLRTTNLFIDYNC